VIEGEVEEKVFQLFDSGEQLHAHVFAFRLALKEIKVSSSKNLFLKNVSLRTSDLLNKNEYR
jgi:hypothetical protein